MTQSDGHTARIQALVDRLIAGDESARDDLIQCAWNRIMRMTRRISRDYPGVRRWEQTEDVFQNALLRLWKALEKVELNDARHFLRLAAEKIRFELIDLARHYYGPRGQGGEDTQTGRWQTGRSRVAARGFGEREIRRGTAQIRRRMVRRFWRGRRNW